MADYGGYGGGAFGGGGFVARCAPARSLQPPFTLAQPALILLRHTALGTAPRMQATAAGCVSPPAASEAPARLASGALASSLG